jgi:hypothetical protein
MNMDPHYCFFDQMFKLHEHMIRLLCTDNETRLYRHAGCGRKLSETKNRRYACEEGNRGHDCGHCGRGRPRNRGHEQGELKELCHEMSRD